MKNNNLKDIKFFKEEYHSLYTLLEKCSRTSYKLIEGSMGAPEGPYELQEIYQLTMRLRKSETFNPSKTEIFTGLDAALRFLSHYEERPKISALIKEIENHKKAYTKDQQ